MFADNDVPGDDTRPVNIRMAGDEDRDASDIPYSYGNRRARRRAKRALFATRRSLSAKPAVEHK